ncbi:hypothetical protein [Paraburkholderia tropica]|uniref:hypothetical protein n=1 Tax=Paraburkholderia tropica TaxID=92647 RepID=UPI002AB2BFF1|nr:hypothetical protein [Paraburkholderia tropica]
MNKPNTKNAKQAVTWNEAEVAKRALELHDLERALKAARHHMIDRACDFKEREGIERVEHSNPKFRRYTAKALGGVIAAKAEVRKARARLETACRRCPRVLVPRVKTPTPRMTKRTLNRLCGE